MAPRQLRISGTERPHIKEIDTLAEGVREVRIEMEEVKGREKLRTEALVAGMKRHKITEYVDEDAVPPLRITLQVGPDKVKVKEVKPRAEDGEDVGPRIRRGRSAAAASAMDELEAEGDRILENAGHGKLNDPKLKGPAAKRRKFSQRTAAEAGVVKD